MKFALPILSFRVREERHVECDGFYAGAHGTSCQMGIDEIEAKFDQKKAQLEKDAVGNQKLPEAEIAYLDEIRPEVERKAEVVKEAEDGRLPSLVLPLVIVAPVPANFAKDESTDGK